jgi:hypothetical protein
MMDFAKFAKFNILSSPHQVVLNLIFEFNLIFSVPEMVTFCFEPFWLVQNPSFCA